MGKSHVRSGGSGVFSVDYLKEEIKLLEIQVALQKREREVRLAEAALRASYAEEVYGLTTFRSWRVSMMHDALPLLCEEHELQAAVMRKMDERVVLFEILRGRERRKRERREREKESKNISPQQQLRGSSKAKHEPKLVDLHGAGGDGAGEKQLLQRQQLPQSAHLQEEESSEDCYACNEEELPPKGPSSPPPPSPPPPLPSSSQPPSWSPPLSSPPLPPLPSPQPSPPLGPMLSLYLQARSTARPLCGYFSWYCKKRGNERWDYFAGRCRERG